MSSGAEKMPKSLAEEALDRLARGRRPDLEQARRLATDREALARLAQCDPLAVFGLLGVLPPSEGIPPRPRVAPRRRHLWRRGVLAAAAAGLAVAALTGVMGRVSAGTPSPMRIDQVVLRVDSRSAQVIMLVPPTAGGPTVTLIVDEELDL